MSILESDIKAIRQNTEKTHKLVQHLSQQFGKALETLSDQMEKIYNCSLHHEEDDQDANQAGLYLYWDS